MAPRPRHGSKVRYGERSMEIVGVVLSLLGLMCFAYRGINVLVLAPVMALFA